MIILTHIYIKTITKSSKSSTAVTPIAPDNSAFYPNINYVNLCYKKED